MDWISVEDRLPEPYVEVFIWPRPQFHDTCFSGIYHKGKGGWEVGFYNGYDFEYFYPTVTHWMPLHEPPKE